VSSPRRVATVTAVALVAAIAGVGCARLLQERAGMRNAKYALQSVRLASIGLTGADVAVTLGVTNPNEIDAVLDALDFRLFVNDRHIADGATDAELRVPPGEERELPIRVRVDYGDVPGIARLLRSEQARTWRVEGTAHYDTVLGTFDFPVEVAGTFR